MTRQEFQKEITRIIVLTLQIGNPFIRGRILINQIDGLCEKLNL